MKKNKNVAKNKKVIIITILIFLIFFGIIELSLSNKDIFNKKESYRYFTGNIYTANHAANMLDCVYEEKNIIISPYNVNNSLALLYNVTDNNSKKELKYYFKKDLKSVNEEIIEKNSNISFDEILNNKYNKLYEEYIKELYDKSYDDLTIETIKLLSNQEKIEILTIIKKANLSLERQDSLNNLSEKEIKNYKLTEKEISYNNYYLKEQLDDVFIKYESYQIKNEIINYTELFTNGIKINNEIKDNNFLKSIPITELQGDTSTYAKQINDSIKNITSDNISRIINEDEIKENEIIITNTLHFNYKWSEEFKSDKITDTEFYKFNNEIEAVEMMYDIETSYYENSYAKAFSKDFENNKYSFVAILPNEFNDFSLSSINIDNLLLSEKKAKVLIGIPKFSYQSEINIKNIASSYNINEVFSEKANLTGLTDDKTKINKVIQKNKINIGEKGTVNSSMSQDSLKTFSEEEYNKSIILNRPFAFLIRNNESNEIILIGKVISPNESS